MPAYEAYPDSKTMPSRKSRKGARNTVFVKNAAAASKLRKAKKAAKQEREEVLEAEE